MINRIITNYIKVFFNSYKPWQSKIFFKKYVRLMNNFMLDKYKYIYIY